MMGDALWFALGMAFSGILGFFFWKDQYERGYLDACEDILERLKESKEIESDD